jgi:hypothetical protein
MIFSLPREYYDDDEEPTPEPEEVAEKSPAEEEVAEPAADPEIEADDPLLEFVPQLDDDDLADDTLLHFPPVDYNDAEEEAEPEAEPEPKAKEEPAQPVGHRVVPSAPKKKPARHSLWSRAVGTASDLTDKVLDWTDDLSDRFDYMASDPDNEGLVARAIRGSEQIVEGLEEQQRETDEEIREANRRREAREPRREKKPSAFVFLRPEDLEENGEQPVPAEAPEPVVEAEPEQEVHEEPQQKPRRKHERKPKPVEPDDEPTTIRSVVPKEERKQVLRTTRKMQYWLFLIVIGFFGLVGLFSPLRADSTLVEERPLTEKPSLTLAGLWNGDYWGMFEQWYSDTFPMRDGLAEEYDQLAFLGFGPAELVETDTPSTQEDAEVESSTPTIGLEGQEITDGEETKTGTLEVETEQDGTAGTDDSQDQESSEESPDNN